MVSAHLYPVDQVVHQEGLAALQAADRVPVAANSVGSVRLPLADRAGHRVDRASPAVHPGADPDPAAAYLVGSVHLPPADRADHRLDLAARVVHPGAVQVLAAACSVHAQRRPHLAGRVDPVRPEADRAAVVVGPDPVVGCLVDRLVVLAR